MPQQPQSPVSLRDGASGGTGGVEALAPANLEKALAQSTEPHRATSPFFRRCLQESVIRRALTMALVVGPVLTLINQYDIIVGHQFGPRFFLKLGLTFLVPYSVSTYSSVKATQAQATKAGRPVIVTVYPIAGQQLFFRVPESLCKECHLAIRAVRRAVEGLGDPPEVQVRVRPWLNYLPQALLRGGWHPPVVIINGRRFSQGVVPGVVALKGAIKRHLPNKGAER